MTTPATVAIGTLRFGFSTTPAATEAVSTPMNAQSVAFNVPPTALSGLRPLTFQPSMYVLPLNRNQPKIATPTVGTSASDTAEDWILVTMSGPSMLKNVKSQSTPIAASAAGTGSLRNGKKYARYPMPTTAMATLPIHEASQYNVLV